MNISWGVLENWARGRGKPPTGCKLEYEFRPSLMWFPSIHSVHEYWKAMNPTLEERKFWHLESEEQKEWERKYLQAKYRQFKGRRHWECSWQRFRLTDPKGETLILQMNSQGHVDQLKEVDVTQRVLVKA